KDAAAALLADRVPRFASAWLAIVALITIIEMLQGRLHPSLAFGFVILHTTIVGGAVALRKTAWAQAIVVALCGGVAASITGTFASFGGSAETLGALLFALDASAAAFFVWGWRSQVVLNALTGIAWLAALPRLAVGETPLELGGLSIISWV